MWDKRELESFRKKAGALGSVLGLTNMDRLMKELGDIQDHLQILHVAGTNGKGSTCAMLESILRQAGYTTGRYSSPAVFCEEEKYQVNGIYISQTEYISIFEEIENACTAMEQKGFAHPTLFEIETAAAFLWFYQKKCDIVILETGLGGRLDATNIIRKPLCSIITSVSKDHMGFLGNTLLEIAGEKAGIIKNGCPVISAACEPEVEAVLRRVSTELEAELHVVEPKQLKNIHYEKKYQVMDYPGLPQLQLSLLGAYQPGNAICAIETIHYLNTVGYSIGEDAIRQGLKEVKWPGRFEILCENPYLILDGAHNEDAAKKLRETLEKGFTNRKIIYIIGVLADKEHDKMLHCMLPLASSVYTVTPNNPRALDGAELCREAQKYHDKVAYVAEIRTALQRAMCEAKEENAMVVAFGSLSYLGELKKEAEKRDVL